MLTATTGKKTAARPQLVTLVEPVEGEFGRYWVQSSSRPNLRHLVDMWCYDGNGECGCENFDFNVRKHLEAGSKPARHLACRHIKLVREYSAIEFWHNLSKSQTAEDKKRRDEWRNERKRRHANHEEVAEIEGTGGGTLDYDPRIRREYRLNAPTEFRKQGAAPATPKVKAA